jgi:hypothetical protein
MKLIVLLICLLLCWGFVSCSDKSGTEPQLKNTSQFPAPTVVTTVPVVNKARTYYMALRSESDDVGWKNEAEAVVKGLFDAGLQLETVWFGTSPQTCIGQIAPLERGGLIIVDLIGPDAEILSRGFTLAIPTLPGYCLPAQSYRYSFSPPAMPEIPAAEDSDIAGGIVGDGVLHYLNLLWYAQVPYEDRLAVAERVLRDLEESGIEVTKAWSPHDMTSCDCGGRGAAGLIVDVVAESQFLLESHFTTDPNQWAWNVGVSDYWVFEYGTK